MEETTKHTITNGDLITHPELFRDDAEAGKLVDISQEDLAVLGLQPHYITEEDMVNNPTFASQGLSVGELVEIPLIVDEEMDVEIDNDTD